MTTGIRMPTRLFNVGEYYAMAEAGILTESEHLELLDGRIFHKYSGEPRLFSVDDYYAMADAGILAPDERVELIDGEIIPMSPIGDRHAYSVDELMELLPAQLRGRARIRCQNPVRLNIDREIQPDIALLRLRDDSYLSGHPGPDDVLLMIEVSDSTLDYDRNVKLSMYAADGIPETWIVNIPGQQVEAYSEPSGGEYLNRRVFGQGESASPLAFPDDSIPVSRIVPN